MLHRGNDFVDGAWQEIPFPLRDVVERYSLNIVRGRQYSQTGVQCKQREKREIRNPSYDRLLQVVESRHRSDRLQRKFRRGLDDETAEQLQRGVDAFLRSRRRHQMMVTSLLLLLLLVVVERILVDGGERVLLWCDDIRNSDCSHLLVALD